MRYPSPRWTAPVLLCILLFVCILIPPASATVHNVKTECGAVGNGSNDDTAAINACISRLGPGDTLLFPAGTYKIGGSLNAITDDNVTVDVSNSTATIKAGTSGITLLTVGAQSLSASTPLTAASAELDKDLTLSEQLVRQAVQLDPGSTLAGSLQRMILDRQKDRAVDLILSKSRELQAAEDLGGAPLVLNDI